MQASEVEGGFKGLKLPNTVIDKIFPKNAEKWFPGVIKVTTKNIPFIHAGAGSNRNDYKKFSSDNTC
jgi:hypothetical protein